MFRVHDASSTTGLARISAAWTRGAAQHAFLIASFAVVLAGLSACVTERVSGSGGRLRPGAGVPVRPSTPGVPATLPDSPVAAPATSAQTLTARAQVAVLPLGTVRYDGQRLPLVSGDGGLMAVQSGEAPPWGTVLADRSQEPATGTRLAAFALASEGLRPIEWGTPPEAGWMLANGSDSRGFLAERVEPDGSRSIARIAWLTGEVEVLVRDGRVNAHASMVSDAGGSTGPDACVVFVRRPVGSPGPWELVLRDRDGRESVASAGGEASYLHPISSGDGSLVYALALGPSGLEVRAIRLVRREGGIALGNIVVRRLLEDRADAIGAFQVGATMRPAALLESGAGSAAAEGPSRASMVMFSPMNGRASVLDPAVGAFVPLAAKSLTAAPSPTATSVGYYCTTPEGLVFFPWGVRGPASQGAAVFDEPFVPWPAPGGGGTSGGSERGLILIGPVRGQADQLSVVRMFEVVRPGATPDTSMAPTAR